MYMFLSSSWSLVKLPEFCKSGILDYAFLTKKEVVKPTKNIQVDSNRIYAHNSTPMPMTMYLMKDWGAFVFLQYK